MVKKKKRRRKKKKKKPDLEIYTCRLNRALEFDM